MTRRRRIIQTAVELHKDGSRVVYHTNAEPNEEGYAWTHPDTKKERKACSACSPRPTLASVRKAER